MSCLTFKEGVRGKAPVGGGAQSPLKTKVYISPGGPLITPLMTNNKNNLRTDLLMNRLLKCLGKQK